MCPVFLVFCRFCMTYFQFFLNYCCRATKTRSYETLNGYSFMIFLIIQNFAPTKPILGTSDPYQPTVPKYPFPHQKNCRWGVHSLL